MHTQHLQLQVLIGNEKSNWSLKMRRASGEIENWKFSSLFTVCSQQRHILDCVASNISNVSQHSPSLSLCLRSMVCCRSHSRDSKASRHTATHSRTTREKSFTEISYPLLAQFLDFSAFFFSRFFQLLSCSLCFFSFISTPIATSTSLSLFLPLALLRCENIFSCSY